MFSQLHALVLSSDNLGLLIFWGLSSLKEVQNKPGIFNFICCSAFSNHRDCQEVPNKRSHSQLMYFINSNNLGVFQGNYNQSVIVLKSFYQWLRSLEFNLHWTRRENINYPSYGFTKQVFSPQIHWPCNDPMIPLHSRVKSTLHYDTFAKESKVAAWY